MNVFAGPRFEFIRNVDFNNINVEDLKNDYRVGLQFGLGIKFSRFEIDIRAERGFEKNEINYMKETVGTKNQFITSQGKLYLLALSFYFITILGHYLNNPVSHLHLYHLLYSSPLASYSSLVKTPSLIIIRIQK